MTKKIFLLLIFLLSLQGFSQERIWGVQGTFGLNKNPSIFSFGSFIENNTLLFESNICFQNFNNNNPSISVLNILGGYKCLNTKYFSFVFKGGYFLGDEGQKFTNGIWLEPNVEFKIPNKKISFFINAPQLFHIEKEITKNNPRTGIFAIGVKFHLKKQIKNEHI